MAGVRVKVIATSFLRFVKAPILFEVATCAQRTQAQNGLGAGDRPSRAGQVHPIFDEVAAPALNDAGRDRQSAREVLVVAQVLAVLEQVARAPVGRLAMSGGQIAERRAAANARSNIATLAAQLKRSV